MKPPANPTQPDPASRQRVVDQLNVLVQVTQAKGDAIRSRRLSRFSPRARLRLLLIGRALEALALLATLFATPGEAPEAAVTSDPIEPVQAAAPVAAAPTAAAPTAPAPTAAALIVTARLKPAARLQPEPRRPIARPARQPRATSRPASPPQRAGAAPNPIPAFGARPNAPHRPLTPGATSQRLPQAALTR